jgi:hypothetical protein
MSEPKFSDAPCFGKEFDASSKVCRICLGNKSCQRKYFRAFAAPKASMAAPSEPMRLMHLRTSRPPPPRINQTTPSA